MGNPRVAAIDVVLYDHHAGRRPQRRHQASDDGGRVADEVERVRREEPVVGPPGQGERPGEVGSDCRQTRRREPRGHLAGQAPERGCVAVDCGDLDAGPEQIRQRQGDGALARPELEPATERCSSRKGADAGPDEFDVIGVIHSRMMRPPAVACWHRLIRVPGA